MCYFGLRGVRGITFWSQVQAGWEFILAAPLAGLTMNKFEACAAVGLKRWISPSVRSQERMLEFLFCSVYNQLNMWNPAREGIRGQTLRSLPHGIVSEGRWWMDRPYGSPGLTANNPWAGSNEPVVWTIPLPGHIENWFKSSIPLQRGFVFIFNII